MEHKKDPGLYVIKDSIHSVAIKKRALGLTNKIQRQTRRTKALWKRKDD
jgi:hypothetical protein